jgi:tRNA-specific 2-thiouridylase
LERSRELGLGLVATGHYARIEVEGNSYHNGNCVPRYLLKKGMDAKKDQSYVLWALTQDELASTLLPLGALRKEEVRELAREAGLVNAEKAESQDICFVPDGDYGAFIERYRGAPLADGDFLGADGSVLGRHHGQARYTIGQRRGTGVAAGYPLYVTGKSAENNTVTLGGEEHLYAKTMTISELNLIAAGSLPSPIHAAVKCRYLSPEKPATIEQTGATTARLT